MAVLNKEDFMKSVKEILGDRSDDVALKFLEDAQDTITDDQEQWKVKFEEKEEELKELDDSWRTKYKERFYSSDTNTQSNTNNNTNEHEHIFDNRTDEQKKAESTTIDDLFTEKE